MNQLILNYPAIPILATGFTRSHKPIARTIQLVRGGFKALNDPAFPNHAFLTTEDNGQKFATEETLDGLKENSLEQYTYPWNRIVSMYYWHGWDDAARRTDALQYLAYIRREQGNRKTKLGKYDFWGLFEFVPGLKYLVKPNPSAEWCSENCTSIHKRGGAEWAKDVHLAPDQLLPVMRFFKQECEPIFGYYVRHAA